MDFLIGFLNVVGTALVAYWFGTWAIQVVVWMWKNKKVKACVKWVDWWLVGWIIASAIASDYFSGIYGHEAVAIVTLIGAVVLAFGYIWWFLVYRAHIYEAGARTEYKVEEKGVL